MNAKLKILFAPVLLIVVLDQLTKYLIIQWIPLGEMVPVIPGLFDIVHTRNRGAAFGFMSNLPDSVRQPFFFIVSSIALLLIVVYFFRLNDPRKSVYVFVAMILGGAAGNILDRIRLGEVVDFLSFHWYDQVISLSLAGRSLRIRLEWPAFNVADMAITIAVFGLMILMTFPLKLSTKDVSQNT